MTRKLGPAGFGLAVVVAASCVNRSDTEWRSLDEARAGVVALLREGLSVSGFESAQMECLAPPPPGQWSLVARYSATWRWVSRDTMELKVAYHVVGDVRDAGGGYPSYEVSRRNGLDTVEYVAIEVPGRRWKLRCADSLHRYMDVHAIDDPGLYINESEFRRILALADSIASRERR